MKKALKFLLIGLAVIATLFLIVGLYILHITYQTKQDQNSYYEEKTKDGITFKKVLPNDYLLVSKKIHAPLDFKDCIFSKTREPIAILKNTEYYIFLYRLPIHTQQLIKNIIHEDFRGNDYTYNTSYWALLDNNIQDETSSYNIIYKQGGPQKNGSGIFLDVDGTNITTYKKNDSIAEYKLYPKSFSIRYGKTYPKDFYCSIADSKLIGTLPFVIMFIKQGDSIYFAMEITNFNKKLIK